MISGTAARSNILGHEADILATVLLTLRARPKLQTLRSQFALRRFAAQCRMPELWVDLPVSARRVW
jgi:hypothetical protein